MGKITEALKKAEEERLKKTYSEEIKEEKMKPFLLNREEMELDIKEAVVFYHQPKSIIAEQYRILRTNLLSLDAKNLPHSFVVTSSVRGEGKTVTSLNLTIALSSDPMKSVLLVDCDLRKPGLNKLLGLNSEEGLAEILEGEKRLEDLVLKIGQNNLFFLPAGKNLKHPTEILDTFKMRELIKKIRTQFNFLILDTPPAISFSDAGVLGSQVDGILFIVQAGRTQRGAVERAQWLLRQARAKILGMVLTGVEQYIPPYLARYYYSYSDRY